MIEDFLNSVLKEDIGRGDLFSKVYSVEKNIKSYILAKCDGIFSGKKYIEKLSNMFKIHIKWNIDDGENFNKDDKLFILDGNINNILILERTILNLIIHSSSIATLTNKYVQKISQYNVKLLDTRKTRPLLREFEKYSVCSGGGFNHRMGLDDSLMLKDTHLKTIPNLKNFITEARKKISFTTTIEIECETLEDAKKNMELDINIIMCDNMDYINIEKVVEFRNINYPHILVEASGNITLENIEFYAKTGVDSISSGSIIHQANWIDLSMKVY